jgi:hypothetical protein
MSRLALVVLLAAGCDGAVCSPDALARALDGAAPGDVVEVGACEIAGAFVLPAGVTLRGSSQTSALASVEEGAVVDVGGDGARIESLSLRTDHGYYAIRAAGVEDVELSGVDVIVTRGLGMVLRDGTFSLDAVSIDGPVDASMMSPPIDPALTGTVGLATERSEVAIAGGLSVSGFSVAAVSIDGGNVEWNDDDDAADVQETFGIGVAIRAANVRLEGVELSRTIAGFRSTGFALVVADGAMLEADGITISDGDGYGIVSHDSRVILAGSTIEGLGLVGVHAQGGSLEATDVVARDNGGAGITALDVDSLVLTRVTASAQRLALISGDMEAVQLADGVHVRRTSAGEAPIDLTATDLVLEDNARAGLLIDGADTEPARLALTAVRAASTGGAFGAVVQRTMVAASWDAEVVREGAAIANDALFVEVDPAGLLMPPIVPGAMP